MKNSAYKKKIHSSLGGVVLFLSISSIFSIGFSSWNIGSPKADSTIDIDADIAFQKSVIKIIGSTYDFKIGPDGLVVDETIVNKASFSISFSISNEDATSFLHTDGNAHFSINLKCTKNAGFLSFVNKNPSCYSYGTTNIFHNCTVETNSSTSSDTYINKVSLPLSSGNETKFDINYSVQDDSNGTIKSYSSSLPRFVCYAEMESAS